MFASENKRVAKNTLFLYIRMAVVLVVSLYTSRVILNVLGVEDFGVYNVVAGFVSMFAFLNSTLSAAIQRFYNIEIGKHNDSGIGIVYTSGLLIQVSLAVIIFVLLETFGIWYVNHVLVVPPERLSAARIVFHAVVLSTLVVVLEVPFSGAIMAYEKMDYYAFVSVFDVSLKLALAILLPYVKYDKLICYSFFTLLISIANFLLYYVYSKRKFPLLKLVRPLEKTVFKSMLTFSGWNLIGTFAFMLKGQGVNMLLNFFFGPIVNAARGVATQVRGAISGFSNNISIAFRPQIIQSFAEGNVGRTGRLMFTQSKICFALIGLLITPIIFQIDNVLHLWLGNAIPNNTNVFVSLTLVEMLIGTLNPPCTAVVHAVGDLKKYQVYSTVINGSIIFVAWIFLRLGFGAVSAFVVSVIFTIINQIGCSLIACHLGGFSYKSYLVSVVIPCCIYVFLLPILPALYSVSYHSSIWHLFITYIITALVSLPCILFFILNRQDRDTLFSLFIKKRRHDTVN